MCIRQVHSRNPSAVIRAKQHNWTTRLADAFQTGANRAPSTTFECLHRNSGLWGRRYHIPLLNTSKGCRDYMSVWRNHISVIVHGGCFKCTQCLLSEIQNPCVAAFEVRGLVNQGWMGHDVACSLCPLSGHSHAPARHARDLTCLQASQTRQVSHFRNLILTP